jgi:hypothetical protein
VSLPTLPFRWERPSARDAKGLPRDQGVRRIDHMLGPTAPLHVSITFEAFAKGRK